MTTKNNINDSNNILCQENMKQQRQITTTMRKQKVAEARKICPLLPLPEDVDATFEELWDDSGGPQRDFDSEEGILETIVGYSGSSSSSRNNPTYWNIQDYAESIRVTFDNDEWTYEQLLEYFFRIHTPSGAGTQYRSAIFCHTEDQKNLAERVCRAQGELGKSVAIEMASDFYRAEEYHQKYIKKATTTSV
eukprot:CAMPEP_0194170092 /NCGR_PEP_ID=MMETSP0154-20130528/4759_1 /TAXON_ID=1049557 /ORGANISM="Thalassiothrix antarctica, Strain L6-D1" /LENGTH=191 /DNA_ID=CAMNT_0038881799 /DNA_START=82 /DNA_END=657 /DNA_ORIENTATION=-